MSTNIAAGRFAEQILGKLRDIQDQAKTMAGSLAPGQAPGQAPGGKSSGMSFAEHLKQGINEVDAAGKTSDRMAMELATGKSGNIHETMLSATQAELSFNLMVQLRNKGLEAYSEIMKMPV